MCFWVTLGVRCLFSETAQSPVPRARQRQIKPELHSHFKQAHIGPATESRGPTHKRATRLSQNKATDPITLYFLYTQKVGRAPEPAQGVCPASLRSTYRMPFTPYNFYESLQFQSQRQGLNAKEEDDLRVRPGGRGRRDSFVLAQSVITKPSCQLLSPARAVLGIFCSPVSHQPID
uniref:Uncharacterized protein n=1 Tax=Anas platyrhynchos TaxID=8839 RepID=A0A8B9T7W7_ANAPL